MSKKIKITISDSMDSVVRSHAAQSGVTVSEFIRQAVTTQINKADASYTHELLKVGRPQKKGETK